MNYVKHIPLDKEAKQKIIERNSGENSEMSKLTEEKVLNIKIRLSKGDSLKELSNEFGVSTTVISNIKAGKTWKMVKASVEIEDILKNQRYNNRKGKLSLDLVREIKSRLANGERCHILAKEYNLGYTTIHGLKIGHYYKDI